ncbi:proliferation marker protein Ki-67 isoform X2 [Myotis yumanensis]|uniref:proliferation marker protein Ki-67 isoform X2 n=1 Tax=Myotis yumanensis TaxID=159337 RepID=UPI0038D50A0E
MGPTGRLVTIKRTGLDGPHFPLSLSTCLFGRGIECDIRIQLPVVSKQHCKIEVSDQKAVLFNFSATNPTQVNGSAIDGPVQLKHGDVITVIDRSFRYENDSHQNGSKSTEFPGQRREQASPSRVSRSSFPSNPDGKVQDPSAARSQVTEEGGSGGPPERRERVGATRTPSRGSEGPTTKSTADVGSSEPPGDNHGNAAGPPAGGFGAGSCVTAGSWNGGQGLEKDGENESPFRKLYESMKEELDVKSETVLQNRRKSGARGHRASEAESAGGSQSATQPRVSPKSRRRSGRSSQTEAERAGEGPGQTLEATASPSIPHPEMSKAKTPVQCPQPSSSRRRRSGAPSVTPGGEPVSLQQSEDLRAGSAASAPRRLSARQPTPAKGESAGHLGNTAEKVFSRKRRRSLSPSVGILTTGTDIPKQTLLSPLLVPAERKVPGLGAVDVSNVGDSLNKTEGKPLKRRRVSFGGHLRPELFDENLPPNTPLKRGETPMARRSLVTHTPPVLKKIIKEQPPPSEKGGSSEIRLEVTTQNMLTSSPVHSPPKTSPLANDGRRRSLKSPASSGSKSPHQTDAPQRGGRRSSSGPARRASVDRSQHGILQTIHSRRRSGASEANLMVVRSWADVVKLCAKQTQTRVVRHGPPRPPSKRQRRMNTPKPLGSVHNEFSTGHAASPCTIVIGKAHIEKVTVPARPYRMLNNFVINKKIDFNEDLSGLTEMFKTPAKEKPQTMNIGPTAFSSSEDLLGKKFQVLNSEEKTLLCTPGKFGENVFLRAQNAPEEPWDKQSSSPALTQQYVTVNGNMKTPRSETEPPKAASSTNKSRRSVDLRNIQVTSTECEKDDKEVDTVQNILGRCLRKSSVQAQLPEGEMKERERSLETCKKNIEPKENSEKLTTVRRSRRSSELKCTPRAGLIPIQRLQETESKEDLEGIHSFLQNPSHAEEPVHTEAKTILMHCKSPPPVSTPTKVNTHIKTPSQRVNVEDLSDLRKPTQTPGDTTDTQKEPAGGEKSMKEFKEAPEQKLDSSENVTRSRRRSRTPKRKVQPIEDLAGFKELFQTPNHIAETVIDDKTTKTPCKSPKPEPVSTPISTKRRSRTPLGKVDVEEELSSLRKPTPGETTHSHREPEGDDKSTELFKETPKQELDSAENVTGSRRRSKTPKRKVQPMEDLVGFKELFQTPIHITETVIDDKTTKTPCKSPKPEPVSTPTSTKRRSRTPLGKVDVEEELSLRKPTPRPGETTQSHREPEGDDKGIKAFKETPEQKPDSAENIIGSRRSRTPKRKVQPIEDLVGFKELFQTPIHIAETVTDDKITKTPCKSPKSKPVITPTSSKRCFRTPLGKVDVQEALSALRKPTPRRGEATQSHKEPEGDVKSAKLFKETPKQELDSAENVTGSRRRSKTPKRKVQPMEDLVGFKELFQTPIHITETVTDDKIAKTPCKSPKSEPVSTPTSTKRRSRTPLGKVDMEEELSSLRKPTPRPGETTQLHREPEGDDKGITVFKETPKQKPNSAENVTGSRRRSRTPKRKVQPIEDLAGFKELFQTPIHITETVTDDKTKTPCKSPQPEPVITSISMTRRLRTPLGKMDVEEELSALRKPTSGEPTHSHREPEGDDKGITAFKETPEQKLDSAKYATGSRRRSRTPRRKVQPLEDLTGFKELFQTPDQIIGTVTDDKITKTPCKSPKPEPVITPASSKRCFRTPLGKMDVQEALSSLRKPTPRRGEATHSHKEPEGDVKSAKLFKETPKQELDSAENVTGSRRRSKTPKRKVQPIEDLVGFKELFQTPIHIAETVTDDKIAKTPCKSPKSEPVSTPTSTKRRSRTPLGKVDVEEELSSLRKPTPRPGETTHSHREPEGDDKGITAFKETPKQKPDSAENVTGSRRRSRTPKRRVQPIEDLVGFKELFQTPDHTVEPMTDDKTTKISCQSPQLEPVITSTSMTRPLGTPLGKVDVEEELSALRKPTPGETTHSHRDPEGDDNGITVFKETPKQKPDSAEHVTGSRRRSRTPKRRVQPIEDLTGFKELFQTPDHIMESLTDDKTTKIPCKSQNPEPVIMLTGRNRRVKAPQGKVVVGDEVSALRRPTRAPGKTTRSHRAPEVADKDTKVFMEIPEEKSDPAENVTGSKRRPRTRKEKAQPLEDLAGLKDEPETVAKTTEMPSKSPQPEAVMPARRKRQVKVPPGKVDMEEELSAPRKPTRTSAKTTRSHRAPEVADKDIKLLKEIPEEKSDPAENVTGSKRRLRTRKEKAQPLEDLAGLKEPFQIPSHTEEPETVVKTTEMPSRSPQPEAVLPARRKRQVKAPPGKVDVEEELSAPRKPTRTSAKTTRSRRAPEVPDKDIKLLREIPEEKSDPAENVTGSKRRPRTCKEKAQPLEDLDGLKDEPETVVKTTEMPSKPPQPEAVMPARRKRQVKAPPRKVDVEEELSAPRTSGKTTRSHREPVDIKVFKESPRQKLGAAENTESSKRQLRSRKGKAQPPEGPARCQQSLQSSFQDEELGIGAESVRTPTQAPSQSKPSKPRRVLWALDIKPMEDQVGSRDPVKSQRGSSVSLPPKRKREDGSPTRMRRLRTSTRAQDPAEEKPPAKRQRAAPQERREPPEPLGVKKRRGALAESTEDVPSEDMKTKNRGRGATVATSPGKEMSLRSRLPNKASSAERTPEGLLTADKVKTKRSGKKPVTASPEAGSQPPEDGARSSASGDTVRERRTRLRPGRRGEAPSPGAAGEKAGETSVETHGKTQEERGAQRADSTRVRPTKGSVPPTGDTSESQPKPRVTRSAKRPAEKSQQENDDAGVKKIRTRSRRGRDDV